MSGREAKLDRPLLDRATGIGRNEELEEERRRVLRDGLDSVIRKAPPNAEFVPLGKLRLASDRIRVA